MRSNVHNKTAGVDETAKLFKILQNVAAHVLLTVHYRKKKWWPKDWKISS